MHIYYNNQLIEKAFVDIASQGFQFGFGVFETILVKRGVPCFADLHYERLAKSCSRLGLKLSISAQDIIMQSMKLSEVNGILEGRLKVICFRDVDKDSVAITLTPYKPNSEHLEKGLSLKICSIKRNPYSPLCYVKSLNYAENILAKEEAKAHGFDEALFLNVHNKLSEGAVSNLFWIKGNKVFTPSIENGILDGITRRQVIGICQLLQMDFEEGIYEASELLQADEVFVTNSLMGIMPVCKVDNTKYNVESYKITNKLRYEFNKIVEHSCQGCLNK